MRVVYLVRSVSYKLTQSFIIKTLAYLGRKFQAGQGLTQMSLEWADHDKHERLRISTKRKLEQVCQLEQMSAVLLANLAHI